MSVAKVTINGTTILDLTDATATANSDVVSPKTAYSPTGTKLTGSATAVNNQTATKTYTPTTSQQTETVTPDSSHTGLSSVAITVNAIQTETASATPSETAQTIEPSSGKYLSSVSVGAISSSYVGSAIDRRDSTDLSASGATVTVPSGYYSAQASKSVSSGSATAPASITGTSASVSTGTNTLTLSKTVSVTPSVSAGYVSSGTAGNSSVSLTASVTTQAAKTVTPTTSSQTAVSSGTYCTGAITVGAIPSQYIVTTDATATAAQINDGATAYVNGSKITGTQVIQTYYTGTSTPSSSLGSNGDIYLKTAS